MPNLSPMCLGRKLRIAGVAGRLKADKIGLSSVEREFKE